MFVLSVPRRVFVWVLCLSIFALVSLAASSIVSSFSPISGPSHYIFESPVAGDSVRVLPLASNDLVFSSTNEKLYLSVPSRVGATGNSILPLDPRTGAAGTPVFVGSEPGKLAMANDGQTLYVYLGGAYSLARFNTASGTVTNKFAVGSDSFYGWFSASDLAISPLDPNLVAVARQKPGISPPQAGVAVYQNGVRLPQTGPDHVQGSDYITFGASNNVLYGLGYGALKTFAVSAQGLAVSSTASIGSNDRIKLAGGKIFTGGGQVIDAASGILLGTFPVARTEAFVPEPASGRAYYVTRETSPINTYTVRAFDIATFTQIGSLVILNLPNDSPTSLVRWGTNGLAFRTASTDNLVLVQTLLIPTNNPLPDPSPSATPTPTPSPTPYSATIRRVSVPNQDLVYVAQQAKLYVSVPSSAGPGLGNTVTSINPETATVGNSIFVGSEPSKLAITNDGTSVYVGLNGAGAVKKVDLVSASTGPQFSLSNSQSNFAVANDLDVSPLSTSLVAVSRTNSGVAVYDNGQVRPQSYGSSSGYSQEFDLNGSLYVSANSSFVKLGVGPGGLFTQSTIPSYGFGSGTFKLDGSRSYFPSGRVFDLQTETPAGTFAGTASDSSIAIDRAKNRIYFLVSGSPSSRIDAFELDTFKPAGFITLPGLGSSLRGLVRWGINGLAFRTDTDVFVLQSTLLDPVAPVPTPVPTVSPTPTPLPEYVPTFVRQLDFPVNDLTYNNATGTLIASIPASGGAGLGNTISHIDPNTGDRFSSVFVGSEPSKIGISDDGQTIYVTLEGANSMRRYNVVTRTPGLQFSLPAGFTRPLDIAVRPAAPETIALAAGQNGVAIFDNGIQRPAISKGGAYAVNSIEFNGTPDTIYGYNSESSGYELVQLSVIPSGVTGSTIANNLASSAQITFRDGLLYTTSGRVIDPITKTVLGAVQGGGPMAVDPPSGRVYYLESSGIGVYDLSTYVKIGTISFQGYPGGGGSLVRWGPNGLAFRSNGANSRLYLVQSAMVSAGLPLPTGISLNAATYSVSEGSSQLTATINRTGNLAEPTTVTYSTADGTATAGSDYTTVSGKLSFAPGEASKAVSIPILNDNIYEGTESFSFAVSVVSGAEPLAPGSATITLNDNDPRPTVSTFAASVQEPRSGFSTLDVRVELSRPSIETITVGYSTSNLTALAGLDYASATGTLTFGPLQTVKTVPIQIFADGLTEPNETFQIVLSSPFNATLNIGQATITIQNTFPRPSPFDFDGDGRTDLTVRRPSDNIWYFLRTTAGYAGFQYGESGDRLVPADYDGDLKTDVAVFRPSSGVWYIAGSSVGFYSRQWGEEGDIPAPADYDGDLRADIAVYRPSDGTWYRVFSNGNIVSNVQFGTTEDKPMPADYDGDRKADLAVRRPSDNTWYFLNSTAGFTAFGWGTQDDIACVGDFDGDGRWDPTVFRPSEGRWYIAGSSGGIETRNWGTAGDVPVAGDYDGNGRWDVAVFRPSNRTWYIINSSAGVATYPFGELGDDAVPAAYAY